MTFTKSLNTFLMVLALAGVLSGCSTKQSKTRNSQTVSSTAVHANTQAPVSELSSEPGSHVVSTIRFPLGQSQLTSAARAEIDKAIRLAQNSGEVEEVIVAVWSDQELPLPGEKLPKPQVNLADKRGDEIEEYLDRRLNVDDVEVHNMAVQPTYLGKTFKTADARLKEDLVKSGIAPVGNSVATNRRSSTALILVKSAVN